MTVTQTIEVPASRRIIVDVPPQTPTGSSVVIQFPVQTKPKKESDKEIITRNAEWLNKEMEDILSYQVNIWDMDK